MTATASAQLLPVPEPAVQLCVVRERSALEVALESVLQRRGATDIKFEAVDESDEHQWCFGASLRLACDDGMVQDYALFASRENAETFVRWLYGFKAAHALNDVAVLDGIGETLNQLVGRIKEVWIQRYGTEPLLGTPKLLNADGCALYFATHRDATRTTASSEPWQRGLQVVAGERQDPATCALDEVLGLLEAAGDDVATLLRGQAALADVREHLIGELRVSAEHVLSWSSEQLGALINGAARDRSHITSALRTLREQVIKACRRHDFEIPTEADLVGLIAEFVEEARGLLESSRKELESGGPIAAQGLFRAMHTIKGNAGFFGLEQVQRLAHSTENMLAQARDRATPLDDGQVRAAGRSIALIGDFVERTAEKLESGGMVPYQRALDLHRALLDTAVASGISPVMDEAAAPAAAGRRDIEMVRVASTHLEALERIESDFAALMALAPATSATPESGDGTELESARADLVDLHGRLADACRSLRRVGLDRLFGKVRRLCAETAEHLGKLAQVNVLGDELDAPRHLTTALSGPLVHLARNAIDHGIEDPEERRQTGKPLLATIECRASWHGAWLLVEIGDDGRGVDPERVRSKAERLGLIAADAELSQQDVLGLLMAPGFSTAEKTTDISGRGVGLDVVRKEIEGVGGRVELHSTLGAGSTFRILLPESPQSPPFEDAGASASVEDEPPLDLADCGELTFL